MPFVVRWTDNALQGLLRVYAFGAATDTSVAQQALDAVEAGADRLEHFPHAGRPSPDLEPEQRELLIPFGASGYVLFYEMAGDFVYILAIKHQKEAGY